MSTGGRRPARSAQVEPCSRSHESRRPASRSSAECLAVEAGGYTKTVILTSPFEVRYHRGCRLPCLLGANTTLHECRGKEG